MDLDVYGKNKIAFLCLLFLFIFSSKIFAIEYRGSLDDLARSFYELGNIEEVLEELLLKEEQLLSQKKDHFYYVTLAEIELFRGEMKKLAKLDNPEEHYQRAFDLSRNALELEETSLAKRQVLESLTQLFQYRNLFFLIRNANQALQIIEVLMDKEPVTDFTLLVYGMYYINAPSIGGGDPNKGVQILERVMEKDHPVFNFIILNLFSTLDFLNYDKDYYLKKAKEIYPKSPWIGQLF